MTVLTIADLAAGALADDLAPDGRPAHAVRVVDLDAGRATPDIVSEALSALADTASPVVGMTTRALDDRSRPIALAMDTTVSARSQRERFELERCEVAVSDLDAALDRIRATATTSPSATRVLCQLLRVTERLPVPEGLTAESFAYSALLAGPEFAAWRRSTPRRTIPAGHEPVRLERAGGRLTIALADPERRNAFSRGLRDALVDALTLPALDPTITEVALVGDGPAFCSGGDLDEFGTRADVVTAHHIRCGRSAGRAVHRIADRVTAHLHGWCIGAGIEVAAFAGRVLAAEDTRIRLPELRMGLIPGAGGTVSLTRRMGRWRTAYVALSDDIVGVDDALAWGVVDARA